MRDVATKTTRHKVGVNKGKPRVWLDGPRLLACGFTPGTRFACLMREGEGIALRLVDDLPSSRWHWRTVTGRDGGKPIVDMTGAEVRAAMGGAGFCDVTWAWGGIVVNPAKD